MTGIRVAVELSVHANAVDNSNTWKKFFAAHEGVRVVDLYIKDFLIVDLVVYYKDSEEPFPITSLRADSQIRIDLEEMLDLA